MQTWTQIDALLQSADTDQLDPDRRAYFAGLKALQAEQLDEATKHFKQAAREKSAPWDALALVALGECERVANKQGLALKTWKKVVADTSLPEVARLMAWTSIAAVEAERGHQREAALAEAERVKLCQALGLDPHDSTAR
jgi:hypothetical protein